MPEPIDPAPRPYPVRSALAELTLARVRELAREPEALFWVFVFPILMAAILGIAFRSHPPEPQPVGIVDGPHAKARLAALSAAPELAPRVLPEAEAQLALARAKLALVVSADDPPAYALDPTRPESVT